MLKTMLTYVENVVVIVAVGVLGPLPRRARLAMGDLDRRRRVGRAPLAPPQRNGRARAEATADWRWLIMPTGTVTTKERRAAPTLSLETTSQTGEEAAERRSHSPAW